MQKYVDTGNFSSFRAPLGNEEVLNRRDQHLISDTNKNRENDDFITSMGKTKEGFVKNVRNVDYEGPIHVLNKQQYYETGKKFSILYIYYL